MTPHKDCPSQDLTKLKYKAFSLISWSGQFHLDSRTDFTSTWLCSKTFWSWIKNLDSPAPKHSELLASLHGDLRSEGHLYPYPFGVTLDSIMLWSWSHSVKCTSTYHLHAIPMSLHYLVTRTTNAYGIQRPTFDIAIILVIAYHLVVNQFKDYMKNSSLLIKVVLRTSSQHRSLSEDVTLW